MQGDIALAFVQHWQVTGDLHWLKDKGFPVIEVRAGQYCFIPEITKEIPPETRMCRLQGLAQFWASRADRAADGTWHIRNTMSPDEYSGNSSDPPYTTAVAQITLRAAVELAPLVGTTADLTLKTVADGLRILYDGSLDYHPEHIGYLPNQTIKQADVVMLGYPLAYNMSETTQRNDLAIYANVTDPNGPGKFVAQRSPT